MSLNQHENIVQQECLHSARGIKRIAQYHNCATCKVCGDVCNGVGSGGGVKDIPVFL